MDERDRAYALHQAGDLVGADAAYRSARVIHPGDIELAHFHAVLLMQGRRTAEAADGFADVLARAPGRPESLLALALCCRDLGDPRRGLPAAEAAVRQLPRDPMAWMLLGCLQAQRGAPEAAENACRRAVALAPGMHEAWHHLGEALQAQQRWREATEAYARALPGHPGEHFNLGLCEEMQGRLEEALTHYLAAVRALPGRADALARLAQIQARLCDFDGEAASCAALERLLAQPDRLAADDQVEAFALSFLPLSEAARATALDRYARRIGARAPSSGVPRREAGLAGQAGRVLRLGYLSPDFGDHAVGVLMREVFAAHDRSRVQVFGFSLRRHAGPVAERIRAGFDAFHDCQGMATDEVVALIAGAGLDVLIDLGGYTEGARPEVLAARPAPKQLGYLGFIHPHAAPWLDALLMDDAVLPVGQDLGEPVLRMAGCMLPGSPLPAPPPATRETFGLPADRVLLASFNNSYKVDRALVGAWVEIGRRAPSACFVVYLPDAARSRFSRAWAAAGGDLAQLFLVPKLPPDAHAARMACCDLFLDAFRYQAGATGVAAAAAGLPVLVREGKRPLARLGVSLNRLLGLDALVCADTADYIARAAELANRPSALVALRERLAGAVVTSGLCDPRRTAAAIESIIAHDPVPPVGGA